MGTPAKEPTSTPKKQLQKSAAVVDSHYCNPDAQIILVSKDNVIFKAEAWYMAKQSEFIKHLISVPSDQKLSQAPIQLEYNQIAVRRFIDLMCISTGTSIFIEISLHKEILGLCDMFQAPTIAQIVLDTLTANLMSDNPGTQLDAWDIFKVAAIRDDIVLAKAAIRAFDSLGHDAAKMIATEEPSFYDGIPSRYVYALSRAVVRQPGPESRGYRGSSIHMKSSKQISEAFALSDRPAF